MHVMAFLTLSLFILSCESKIQQLFLCTGCSQKRSLYKSPTNVYFCLHDCRENKRLDSETRAKDYLKQEFKERISRGVVKYKLQISLHIAQSDDPTSVLDIARYWDEATHPWLDVADVTLTTLLNPDVTAGMRFNPGTLPNFLSFLPARSVRDSNCIAHIRKDVYALTQKIRAARNSNVQLEDVVTYTVRVETGDQSGSDSNVSMSLTGMCPGGIFYRVKCDRDIP